YISYNNQYITDNDLLVYLIITSTAIIVTNCTMILFGSKNNQIQNKSININLIEDESKKIRVSLIFFSIGAFSKLYLIMVNGGIYHIWNNINARTFMLRGNGYTDSLEIFLVLGLALMLDLYYSTRNKRHFVLFFIMLILSIALLVSFGA